MKTRWYIYTLEYYSAIEQIIILAAVWMNQEIILCEVSQRETDNTLRYHVEVESINSY